MTPTAVRLANALLDHHSEFCVPHTLRPPTIDRCVVTDGDLCRQAGTPGLERGVGRFLQEVAEWCAARGYPPINALAVNAETRSPGERALGC